MAVSSRLPERYHITTLSPFLIGLPASSVSASAVRRMWASGVCQRMISGTALSISAGLARSLAICSGCWCSASTPPVIELRVVSLPPTISSSKLPRYSCGDMWRVAGACANIEIRSPRLDSGGALTRSFHSRVK